METKTAIKLTGFPYYLVTNQFLNEQHTQEVVQAATEDKRTFILQLIRSDTMSQYHIALATSQYFGLPLFDLDSYDQTTVPTEYLPANVVQSHQALPLFKHDKTLFVAVSDPTLPALSELTFLTGMKTDLVIVEAEKLDEMITLVCNNDIGNALGQLDDTELEAITISSEDGNEADADDKSVEAPIVRFINKMLIDAINQGASDIHFEPFEKFYRIRYRLDGILSEASNPPIKLANYIATRLKVMANIDISERRVPQDGRFKLKLSQDNVIDFRVNTCPTIHGEKIVLRILESSSDLLDTNQLGMTKDQQDIFNRILQQSQGMILVTGPTGSGKTVTLYTGLNILNNVDKNISTVEDPVEIHQAGINQVHVNNKAGLTFAAALRAFLRQDPDIIMVGEIRDLETAEIAVKAAQTGHLVLSTLHTNSAPETLIRLANMGVPSYNIASTISLIIAQRLVRRLCDDCKQPIEIPAKALLEVGFSEEEIPSLKLFGPGDCKHCNDGYKGRIGIYQVMPISEAITKLILKGGSAIDIAEQAAQERIPDVRMSGLDRVREGLTSLDEINRVT